MTAVGDGGPWRKWVIVCEGFHDRDFLSGLFGDRLGWASLLMDPGHPGAEAGKARHAWQHPELSLVATILPRQGLGGDPAASETNTRTFFEGRLKRLAGQPLAGLVLCLDEDDAPSAVDARTRARTRVTQIVTSAALGPYAETTGALIVDDGPVVVLPVTWCADDAPAEVLPPRQNLERMVVAACVEAHPSRGALVRQWLASRGDDVPPGEAARDKAFSWSHMAGWFPSPGGQSFFRALWQQDAAIASALERRLSATGIDTVLAAMTTPGLPGATS